MMAPTSTTAAMTATMITMVDPLPPEDEPDVIWLSSDCAEPATLLAAPLPADASLDADDDSSTLRLAEVEPPLASVERLALSLAFSDVMSEDEDDEDDKEDDNEPLLSSEPDSHVEPLYPLSHAQENDGVDALLLASNWHEPLPLHCSPLDDVQPAVAQ